MGHPQWFRIFHSETRYARKNIVVHSIIYYCRYNIHFHVLCIWSIDGNSAVHLWHSSAMNGPVAKVNKIFFFSNYCRWVTLGEGCFPNIEKWKLFQAMFVLCLYKTRSFIFVSNSKLVYRRQPIPMCITQDVVINCHEFAISSLINSSPRNFVSIGFILSRKKR